MPKLTPDQWNRAMKEIARFKKTLEERPPTGGILSILAVCTTLAEADELDYENCAKCCAALILQMGGLPTLEERYGATPVAGRDPLPPDIKQLRRV